MLVSYQFTKNAQVISGMFDLIYVLFVLQNLPKYG
jgi:hypothetical protein